MAKCSMLFDNWIGIKSRKVSIKRRLPGRVQWRLVCYTSVNMPPSTSHHAWRILHVIVLVVCSSGARSVVCFLFLCSSDHCESGRHWRKGHRYVWSLFWWNCYALFCVRVFPICCCVYQLLFPCEGWFRVQLPYNRARIFNNRSYFFPFFRRAK